MGDGPKPIDQRPSEESTRARPPQNSSISAPEEISLRPAPAVLAGLVSPALSVAAVTQETALSGPSQPSQLAQSQNQPTDANPVLRWFSDAYSQFGGASKASIASSVVSFGAGLIAAPFILSGSVDAYQKSLILTTITGAAFWIPFFTATAWQDRQGFKDSHGKFALGKIPAKLAEYFGVWISSESWYTPARTALTGLLLNQGLNNQLANGISQAGMSLFYISIVPIIRKISSDIRRRLTKGD